MKMSDRWHTTRFASTQVNNLLLRKEYSSALLLAFIYVDIRLTTLLTDSLSPSKHKWQEIADLVGSLGFRRKFELCKKKGLLNDLPSSVEQLDTELEKLRKTTTQPMRRNFGRNLVPTMSR